MSNEINIEELERLAKELIGSVPGTASYRDLSIVFTVTMSPDGVLSLIDRLKKAESELERERMRLAACGVVALADTPESAAQAREMRDEYRSASCDDVARRVDECMTLRAERDALAAKLKEQDAWIDDLLAICHRLALELECLLLDTKDLATVSRWWDSAMAALDGWHKAKDAASVRPVPAEPVNARLVEALLKVARMAEGLKRPCGMDPESPQAIRNGLYMNISYVARSAVAAEAQQAEPACPAAPGKLTCFHDHVQDQFCITWEPEES